ncbi:MAG: T9SS type A sorting domain-containing protein [Candidatus Cloacimonadota bacterium]|nr:T9SS type A sorting domain-containing protein [Candidatus Cloacimonadota bacterium]
MKKIAFLLVVLSLAFFYSGCNPFSSEPEEEDDLWENVEGVSFPVYIGHFADYEKTDEEGNLIDHIVYGEGGDNKDWTVFEYDPSNKQLASFFELAQTPAESETSKETFYVCVRAFDNPTGAELAADISFSGSPTGHCTPHTFTHQGLFDPSLSESYTVALENYVFASSPEVSLDQSSSTYTFTFGGDYYDSSSVVLSSFTATLTADLFVKLTWVTQSETNMVGYRVYRSTSADFASAEMLDIPMVPATNTSSSATYTVTDSNVLENNTYYYWLETIDYHETQFFGPTSVFVESVTPPVTNQTKIVKSGPNPFKIGDTYNIQLDVKTGETGTVTIYNVIGQVVRTYSVTGGSNQLVKWDGKDSRGNTCGSGIYFYKLSTPSVNQSKKIVVVK